MRHLPLGTMLLVALPLKVYSQSGPGTPPTSAEKEFKDYSIVGPQVTGAE